MNHVRDFFQSIKDCIDRPISLKPRSNSSKKLQYLSTYPSTTLPALPVELIKYLAANFLEHHEEALLALTCKQMLHALGTQSWTVLAHSVAERKMFIQLLMCDDLPDYYPSQYSSRRKLLKSLPSAYKKGSRYHYRAEQDFLVPYARFGYAVLWPHVVFALRANSLGTNFGIPLDAFTYCAYERSMFSRIQVRLTAEARIVSDHLLLKCVYTVLRTGKTVQTVDREDLKPLHLDICR